MNPGINTNSSLNTALSLQQLQARQAFGAGGASRTERPLPSSLAGLADRVEFSDALMETLEKAAKSSESVANGMDGVERAAETARPERTNPAWSHLPFEDIQAVAQKVGYLELPKGSIERAYAMGESLLADYRA